MIDLLEFYVGDLSRSPWPRAGTTWPENPTDFMHLDVRPTDQWFAYVKFANPLTYEAYRWDDAWIYFHEDRTDGTGTVYWQTHDKVLPRVCAVHTVQDNPDNWLVRVNAQGEQVNTHHFPLRYTLSAHFEYDCGPLLGTREVVLVTYEPYNPHGYFERFYYVQGAGWGRWEGHDQGRMFAANQWVALGGTSLGASPPMRPIPGPTIPRVHRWGCPEGLPATAGWTGEPHNE